MQRGHPQEEANQDPSEEAAIKHISFYEGYTPKYPIQEKECNTNELQGIINRNKHILHKINGISHIRCSQVAGQSTKHTDCDHPHKCLGEIKLLKTEKLTDHPRRIPSEDVRDTESLIKVELHRSTIICADHTTYPAVPKNMTNYTDRDTRINSTYCKAYSGKMLRHNAILKPARHSVTWISVSRSKDEPRFFTFTDTFTEQGNIQASKKGH